MAYNPESAAIDGQIIATLPPRERGECPNCGHSLDGGGIWLHFFHDFTKGKGYWLDEEGNYINECRLLSEEEAAVKADEVAANYGASRTKGRWGTAIALVENDRVREQACGSCGAIWNGDGLTGRFLDRERGEIHG